MQQLLGSGIGWAIIIAVLVAFAFFIYMLLAAIHARVRAPKIEWEQVILAVVVLLLGGLGLSFFVPWLVDQMATGVESSIGGLSRTGVAFWRVYTDVSSSVQTGVNNNPGPVPLPPPTDVPPVVAAEPTADPNQGGGSPLPDSQPVEPTAAPSAIIIVPPTYTPLPTYTPVPTATPEPTIDPLLWNPQTPPPTPPAGGG